jgi:hypothetical protein
VIPLYGFLAGDTIGLLVLADPQDRAVDLCAKLQSAASVRVAPLRKPIVIYRGHRLAPALTVAEASMAPLERFDVVEERG